ncbi:hypothetical protein DL95DRAFT_395877, partial [Leptodontidium sp. 2 PMI_412]
MHPPAEDRTAVLTPRHLPHSQPCRQQEIHFNIIALASILVTLVSIDGPLLQRASKVTTKGFLDISMVTVNFSPNMSMVYHPTGRSTGRASGIDVLSNSFLPVVQS